MGISIIIPVHNGGELFRQCLDSIHTSRRSAEEVIVVADGDTDGSWQVAENFGARVFRFSTAGGPARARNRGAQNAREDILFFIELGYRLKHAGYSIRLCKAVQVKHLKRWGPISLLRAEIFYRALPWTDLILRHRRLDTDLILSHSSRWSVILTFGLVGSFSAVLFFPWASGLACFCALGLLLINLDLYRFFYHKRGFRFTLRVIPWHWLYFLYGGGAFGYGLVKHQLNVLGRLEGRRSSSESI